MWGSKSFTSALVVASLILTSCGRVQEEHFASGKLSESIEINSAGVLHGKAVMYYENGKLQAEGQYLNGVKSGTWQWFDSTGVLAMSGSYLKGKQEGKYVEYFPNGKPKCIMFFSMGLKNGPAKTFHPNGSIASVVTYQDGLLNDTSRFYYPSGVLSMLSVARNDTVVMYIEYDSTGTRYHQFSRFFPPAPASLPAPR